MRAIRTRGATEADLAEAQRPAVDAIGDEHEA